MKRRAWLGAAVLSVLLLAFHIAFEGALSELRGKTFDVYQTLLPAPAISSPVVLVAIDDNSLEELGRWPWNRGQVARLVDAVHLAGATAIGLDILFPEPDTAPGGAEGDNLLAIALANAPTVLAVSANNVPAANQLKPKAGWSLVGEVPDKLPSFDGTIGSMGQLNDAAAGLGIIRAIPDRDGTLRKLPLVWLQSGADGVQLWPSFALELVRLHVGETGFAARMEAGGFDALKLGSSIVPLSPDGSVLLRERYGSVPAVSAARLLSGEASPELVGAIAIIAVHAAGLDQYHITPAQVARLGADIHAMLIEQILTGKYPAEPQSAKWLERGWFAAGSVLILIFAGMISVRPLLSVTALSLIIASPFIGGLAAFALQQELYEGLQPAAGLLLVAMASGYANFRVADQRRKILARQFSQFLSPAIVRQLANSDAEAMIIVEKREVTVLIMDIRGFTAMTHTLAASEIVTVVNHFLGIATDEILKRDGTIDKFMGDAVLAIWNAPIEVSDHADRALSAALAIINRVQAENDRLAAQGLPSLRVGAGLETGVCSVGNFGSARRIDYTAIGDTVNMASRLEGATKKVGVPLLTGPGFQASVSTPLNSLGPVELQGFDEAIETFSTYDRS